MVVLRLGARGDAVLDLQARLGALGHPIDRLEHGTFGPSTERAVRTFQQRRQLIVDGSVGDHTWSELVEAGYASGDRLLYLRFPSFRGDDVRALQGRLNLLGFDAGREDGIFGERTDAAVREFQRNVGLPSDGIVGATTLQAFARLRPVGPGPGRAEVREAEALRRLHVDLSGIPIAVALDTGPRDVTGPTGLSRAGTLASLAAGLEAELLGRGAKPTVVPSGGDAPPPETLPHLVNHLGPAILVALNLGIHEDPSAEGATVFYYGRDDYESRGGRRLAELIQAEVAGQLGLKDDRCHPKSLPILRETRMPAVHVEPCFLTNPREERLLSNATFVRRLAAAIADGIERFFRQGEEDGDHDADGGSVVSPASGGR
jgi:N-acetylmuramoyl-L-alanine amidase